VLVRNTGSLAWAAGGSNPVRLGYHWLDAAGQPVSQPPSADHRTPLPADVTFGHTAALATVQVTAPATPGRYTLALDMVHEGIAWFHSANAANPRLELPLVVQGADVPDENPVRNGGFESDGDWVIYQTTYPARFTTRVHRTGSRALQTGIENLSENVFSYSSAEQSLRVPSGEGIQLRYWYQGSVGSGDYVYALLQPEGQGWRLLHFGREGAAQWSLARYDLSAFAGQTVTLRFGTFNDGRGGVSVMYVDDVSISVGDVEPEPTRPTPPSPSSTPTPRPTATPTPLPTPTSTPTSTATPTPTPAGETCVQAVQNGGFDVSGGWVIANTPAQARLTTAVARSGPHSLQTGITAELPNVYSYSSAEQRISIPAGQRATVSLWYTIPVEGSGGDYGYLLFRTDDGVWHYLGTLRGQTAGWERFNADISSYVGQTIALRVGTRNDGRDARMVMYVDDVSLEVCSQ
jgi:hypothetical protein